MIIILWQYTFRKLLLTEFCVSLQDLWEKKSYPSIATAFFTASTIRSISSLVL